MRPAIVFWQFVADAVFMCKYRRRPHFVLRAAAAVIICLMLSTLFGWVGFEILWQLYRAGSYSDFIYPIVNLVTHFLIFGIVLAATFFCLEESPATILFGNIAAYATQNIATLATNICGSLWPETKFFSVRPVTALNVGVYCACYILTYLLIFLLFRRYIREKADLSAIDSRPVFLLFLIVLAVAVAVRSLASSANHDNTMLFFLLSVSNISCCMTVLFAQFLIVQGVAAKQENDAIRRMSELKLKQYTFTKENIELINVKCHDLKHQLLELKKGGTVDKEYIDKLASSVSFYDAAMETGNEALDVVLTEKNIFCSKNDIQFSAVADGKKLQFMSVSDIYSLFGNALDNAIEYVIKLPVEKRVIKLSVMSQGNFVSISVRNYFEGPPPRFVGGLPQTSKEQNGYHGFGVKSIQKIAEKYGGSMSVMIRDEQFIVSVLIPSGEKKS